MQIGLLIIRSALGGAMFLQGAAKLTRHGRRDTAEYFGSIGFRPAAPLAAGTAAAAPLLVRRAMTLRTRPVGTGLHVEAV